MIQNHTREEIPTMENIKPTLQWWKKIMSLTTGLVFTLCLLAIVSQTPTDAKANTNTNPTLKFKHAFTHKTHLRRPEAAAAAVLTNAQRKLLQVATDLPHVSKRTASELLEADVLAAGGKPLAEDSIPCGFSFHSNVKSELAISLETTADLEKPASEVQNVLEWMTGVGYSYTLGIQYALLPMFSHEKTGLNIWPRFLGLFAGELNLDDLNQRHGEGQMNVVYMDHRPSTKDMVFAVNEKLKTMGKDVTIENAPPTFIYGRKSGEIDSRVMCLPPLQRTLRQKYCAARALRPVPFTLYTNAAGPKPKHHPIRIAVQLMTALPHGGGGGDPRTVLANLPSTWTEYIDSVVILISQLLSTLRRHTRAAIHIHLFVDSPLIGHGAEGHPLWTLESAAIITDIIRGDSAAHSENEGMVLHSHFRVSNVHSLHHLILSDIVVTGWGMTSFFAATLNEGIVLIPQLPLSTKISNPPTPFYNLPMCGEKTTEYSLKLHGKEAADKQLEGLQNFFAAGQSTTTANTTGSTAGDSLIPFRFELPMRRIVRRRHAEAHVLREVFSHEHDMQSKPNALSMRHCQAIPLADNFPVETFPLP